MERLRSRSDLVPGQHRTRALKWTLFSVAGVVSVVGVDKCRLQTGKLQTTATSPDLHLKLTS